MIIARVGKESGIWDYHFMKRFYSFSTGTHIWAYKTGNFKCGNSIYAGKFAKSVPWHNEAYDPDAKKWVASTASYTSSLKFIVFN